MAGAEVEPIVSVTAVSLCQQWRFAHSSLFSRSTHRVATPFSKERGVKRQARGALKNDQFVQPQSPAYKRLGRIYVLE